MELNQPVACGAKTPGPATPSRSRSGAAPCPCSLSCASLRLSLTEIFNAIVSFPMTKCAITRRPLRSGAIASYGDTLLRGHSICRFYLSASCSLAFVASV
ncbi:hypothetical protein CFAM422_007777 [Trichoderma lentiforme]|uniref:Uncharacterized protein n=1 Tax=Trichoderma lentiforme TaxID=1567552 RepID=A0A9P4XDF8_9HYPO|nr:hypothetical protein CFAM422_007777 [Trichoderma lentiforme]